ncbi:hypothetical protein [Dictyobacter alpinus]|uniref:hypothetical protein n=1 Tax=Dictyobacter alpinus TaxID=2014873 RepID=UPI000F8439AF|nr:hypothetical protein [Dictyobacter alpinus]
MHYHDSAPKWIVNSEDHLTAVIVRPSSQGMQVGKSIQVRVDDRAAIGPWVSTLAAQLGSPLVDSFGAPLAYRLRSVSGEQTLPLTGRFADVRFPSGSAFLLEPVQPEALLCIASFLAY